MLRFISGYTEEDYGNIVTALSEAIHNDLTDPDAVIEPPTEPITQYGDLWILGKHRVLCGDCTRPEDKALLMNGEKPEILLTDPPYCSGGNQESKKSTGSIGTVQKGKPVPKIANDILSTRGYQNLIRDALTDIPCLYAYIFTDWRMWVYLFDLVEAAGFGVKSMLVWDKESPGMGMGWRSQHELVLFGARASTKFDGHKGYGNVHFNTTLVKVHRPQQHHRPARSLNFNTTLVKVHPLQSQLKTPAPLFQYNPC